MNSAPQTASNLNNLGVECVDNGDFPKALAMFRGALKLVIDNFQLSSNPIHQNSQPSDARQVGNSAEMVLQNMVSLGDNSSPFIYASGVNVVDTPGAYSPDSVTNTTIFSAIIIFNLGCVYHIKGLEVGRMSQARLSKAHSLYQKCQNLLSDADVAAASAGNAMVDLVAMALLNNLAQLTFERLEYKESRYYFGQLIEFTMTVASANYGNDEIASLMDVQRQNFLLNAIILNSPFVAAAA